MSGHYKIMARWAGCSIADVLRHVESVEVWCPKGKHWVPKAQRVKMSRARECVECATTHARGEDGRTRCGRPDIDPRLIVAKPECKHCSAVAKPKKRQPKMHYLISSDGSRMRTSCGKTNQVTAIRAEVTCGRCKALLEVT